MPDGIFGSAESTIRSVTLALLLAPAMRQASTTTRRPGRSQPWITSLPPKPREEAMRLPALSRRKRSQSPRPRRRASSMPITAELYVVDAHCAPAAGASVRTDGASSLGTSSAACAAGASSSAAAMPTAIAILRDMWPLPRVE